MNLLHGAAGMCLCWLLPGGLQAGRSGCSDAYGTDAVAFVLRTLNFELPSRFFGLTLVGSRVSALGFGGCISDDLNTLPVADRAVIDALNLPRCGYDAAKG